MNFIKRTTGFIIGTAINAITLWAMATLPGTVWANLAIAWQWGIALIAAFVFTVTFLCVAGEVKGWQETADKAVEESRNVFWLNLSRLRRLFWIVLCVYLGFWGLAIARSYVALVGGLIIMTRKGQIAKEQTA